MRKLAAAALFVAVSAIAVPAQTAEIKLTFDEKFFDAVLDAVFKNLEAPSVSLTSANLSAEVPENRSGPGVAAGEVCNEAVVLKKEIEGVRTAVRFRQGKIYAPIAFLGNYNPPLIGCIEFQGWAETNIELVIDNRKNALVGKVTVLNVNLSGTGGLGGGVVARLVQSSIDRKMNPVEIVSLDKLSFDFPVRDSGSLKMTARGIRHQVNDRSLDVFLRYEFSKGN